MTQEPTNSDELSEALAHLPPETREALETLMGQAKVTSVSIESSTIDAGSLDSATNLPAGLDVDALRSMLMGATAPGAAASNISVTGNAGFAPVTVGVTGGPDSARDLAIRFDREAYAPGDRVQGTITATRPVKAVDVNVELAYCEVSSQFVEHTPFDSATKLHSGTIEPGTEIRFSVQLPRDALPNWDPVGIARTQASGVSTTAPTARGLQLARYGRMYWGIVVTATRRGVVPHTVERHPIPVLDDPTRWPGPPPPSDLPPIGERVKGWDVDMAVPDRAPRRGSQLSINVTIDRPGEQRGELTARLVCEIHHDVRGQSHGTGSKSGANRTTRIAVAHQEVRQLDPGSRSQRVTFEIPADLPFSANKSTKAKKFGPFTWTTGKRSTSSFGGVAFAVRWVVSVQEDRRGRDPRREAVIWVRP